MVSSAALVITFTLPNKFPSVPFTVASLLSSLHQLKEENVDLKDSVDRYVQRRDHLLAVRARLMALNNLSINPTNNSNSNSASASGTTTGAGGSNPTTSSDRVGSGGPGQEGSSGGVANGPSPRASASTTPTASSASITERGRNSTHVSPRNSAATVSPIRVDRSNSSTSISGVGPGGPPSSHREPREHPREPIREHREPSVNIRGSLDQSTSAAVMMASPRTQVNFEIAAKLLCKSVQKKRANFKVIWSTKLINLINLRNRNKSFLKS